jgi:hypothetical protein
MYWQSLWPLVWLRKLPESLRQLWIIEPLELPNSAAGWVELRSYHWRLAILGCWVALKHVYRLTLNGSQWTSVGADVLCCRENEVGLGREQFLLHIFALAAWLHVCYIRFIWLPSIWKVGGLDIVSTVTMMHFGTNPGTGIDVGDNKRLENFF